jgi:hypothetical protein
VLVLGERLTPVAAAGLVLVGLALAVLAVLAVPARPGRAVPLTATANPP